MSHITPAEFVLAWTLIPGGACLILALILWLRDRLDRMDAIRHVARLNREADRRLAEWRKSYDAHQEERRRNPR